MLQGLPFSGGGVVPSPVAGADASSAGLSPLGRGGVARLGLLTPPIQATGKACPRGRIPAELLR